MWLIAGLGNPGSKYAKNRHNIGFRAADTLHEKFGFPAWKKKFQAEIAEGLVPGAGERVLLIKPQTYMNLSGEAVQAATSFYKIAPDNVLVFHDELDLIPGKVKVKQGGGAGGHNGISSIDDHIGKDYWRVRLGIGHPGVHEPNKGELVSNYVLSDFAKADEAWVADLMDRIADAFPRFITDGHEKFMTALHQKD
jgi:PTH1 family peptidyl-tRNA hydrolase